MDSFCKKSFSLFLAIVVAITFAVPSDLVAGEDHVISSQVLKQSVLSVAQERRQKVEQIREFFASSLGNEILNQAGVSQKKIENALPVLSEEELSQLADSTQTVKSNIAAGYHMHEAVTVLLIILIVVAIVLIVKEID